MDEIIQEYIDRNPVVTKENANSNFAISGLKSHIASTILKDFTMRQSPAAKYHKKGCLHLHDSAGGPWSAYCVLGTTGISMSDGSHVTANNIKEGDELLAWDGNKIVSTTVQKVMSRNTPDILRIRFTRGNEQHVDLYVTKEHPVMLTDHTWIDAGDLSIGDEVLYIRTSDRWEYTGISKQAGKNNPQYKPEIDEWIAEHQSKHFCHCGCGQEIEIKREHYTQGIPEYINGHQMRDIERIREVAKQFSGIKRTEEWKERQAIAKIGNKNPNWKGGKSQYCHKFNEKLKEKVRDFYGRVCFWCGKTEEEQIIEMRERGEYSCKLSIHHIYNDPQSGCNGDEMFLVPLCHSCHGKVHKIKGMLEELAKKVRNNLAVFNGRKVTEIEKLHCKTVGKRQYEFKVYNYHCEPHNNFFANSILVHNCRGLDLLQILMEGIKNPAGTSSKPARHYDVACDHIVNSFYVSQNEWEGAQAFSNVDTLLAPFVANDGLIQKEVTQGMQRLVFNLSYPLRAGMQTPFTNLSWDSTCPDHMKNEPAIIGGLPTEDCYGDFQTEMDMINIAFLDVMLQGDKDGNPHTFPIPTYSITKDFNWNCPVTDKLFELTAKFGLPYFMNYVGSGLDPSSQRAMCCRLQMDLNDVIEASKGGLWNAGAQTGSLSVVTINLAQLGYLSRKRTETNEEMVDYFYNRLNTLLDAAREHNVWKREKINEGFEMGLMPFTKSYLPNFNSFFSTIGDVGMNECCLNMFGKPIYKCVEFVEGTLSYLNGYVKKLTKEYGYPWNLEETPAEGCSHSLALKDKAKYPDIITQGSGDSVFYTNSSHIYVGDEVGLGETLRIQEIFKKHYNGGTLQHIFCGESSPNPEGAKDLIRNICTNTTIPYLALTRAYAVCKNCGVISDLSGTCPICKGETIVWDRVTGFFRPVNAYNPGKKAEFDVRNRFDLSKDLDLDW